jgi:hypothetical protein
MPLYYYETILILLQRRHRCRSIPSFLLSLKGTFCAQSNLIQSKVTYSALYDTNASTLCTLVLNDLNFTLAALVMYRGSLSSLQENNINVII